MNQNSTNEPDVAIRSGKRKKWWGLLAAASIPLSAVTAWAVSANVTYWEFVQSGSGGYVASSQGAALMVGYGHAMEQSNTAAVGTSLAAHYGNSLVVGKYNLPSADLKLSGTPTLFVIGNGTNTSSKSNVMEVYNDGSVIVNEAQGDIPMGIYGN